MLAAGIVQDTFAGEAGEGERGGEVETTEGYFYHPVGNSSRFVAIEFLSQITNTRTCIRNVRTYVYIGECGSTLYVGLSRIVRNLIQKSTV